MRDKAMEQFEKELQKEAQRLWDQRKLDGFERLIKKYFARQEFFRRYAISLNFDLGVYTGGGKKWHMVPLAGIASSSAYSGSANDEMKRLTKAYKAGQLTIEQFMKSQKKFKKSLRFSGAGFGVYPRTKWAGQLKRIR